MVTIFCIVLFSIFFWSLTNVHGHSVFILNRTTGGLVVKLDLFTKSWILDINMLKREFPLFIWKKQGCTKLDYFYLLFYVKKKKKKKKNLSLFFMLSPSTSILVIFVSRHEKTNRRHGHICIKEN